jgi:hypothetical protein
VLTCDLHQDAAPAWWRTPAGEWRCNAHGRCAGSACACPTELRRTF